MLMAVVLVILIVLRAALLVQLLWTLLALGLFIWLRRRLNQSHGEIHMVTSTAFAGFRRGFGLA